MSFRINYKSRYKGDGGICLVIGGNDMYTGAPYFAARSSFMSGMELVYVMTPSKNLSPLKTLMPEAVVTNIRNDKWILNRVTTCIVGCGLGKIDNDVKNSILEILEELINIPIIFDGDGIYIFSTESIKFRYHKIIILTPNYNEMKKLNKKLENEFIISKGEVDKIICKEGTLVVKNKTSLKRVCGQGDILTGILAYLLSAWNRKRREVVSDVLEIGCKIIRRSAYLAYEKNGRAMLPQDILDCVGKAMDDILKELK
ncbi:Carbohydrate kinase [Spraguea lophii 42_110]|uniref:ATP-dependent (S)-NAD(P)H-hydrate dehydratase n=1 Tax=Spraguea lophii (strain 42_110) TaxID=1358809 RepID=S7XJP5_SPRLO|nr:Carbohydrate kinase [Spraguea lophii 42_110]